LDVIGFAFVGTPVVELGHNARVAWTATTNYADAMDLWDVETDDARTQVLLGDGAHAIAVRKETIKVKGAEDVEIGVEEVPGYGVLLPDAILPLPRSLLADGDGILFNWTGFRATRELSAYLAMDRARNVDELDRAVDLIDVGAQNFVAADAQNVTYRAHAAVPDRGTGHPMPWRILPGKDAASLWKRPDLPLERFPHRRDFPRGVFGTANNDPFGFTADGDVENDPFYYGAFYANGSRAYRIEQALEELVQKGKITRAEMQTMQDDTRSPFADALVPDLVAAGKTSSREDVKRLAADMEAWDRRFEKDRMEPLAFTAAMWFAVKRVFSPLLPEALYGAIAQRSPPFFLGQLRSALADRFEGAADLFPGGKQATLLGAMEDAASWLGASGAKRYGDVHTATFGNEHGGELSRPPIAIDGANDTIKCSEAPFPKMNAQRVSLYRMVAGFGADGVPEATLNFARGASEDPSSPHFGDQEARWIEGQHVALPFRDAEVAARTVTTFTRR
jgi:penicillin amidase